MFYCASTFFFWEPVWRAVNIQSVEIHGRRSTLSDMKVLKGNIHDYTRIRRYIFVIYYIKEKNQFSLHSNYIFRINEVICTLVEMISPEIHFRLLFNRFSYIHQTVRLLGSQEQFPITTEHKIYIIMAHKQYSNHAFQGLWIFLFLRIGQECTNWLCLASHWI